MPMLLLILILGVLSFLINYPLGRWRSKYRKFTLPWWLLVHASIPILVPLRFFFHAPSFSIPLFIVLAVLGQYFGAKAVQENMKKNTDAE